MSLIDRFRPRRRVFTEAQRMRLVAAIGRAEYGSSGEVRLHVERSCPDGMEPLERARALFGELGMRRTAEDTGVLLYVAVDDRRASVFAGQGIHDAVEHSVWQSVADEVARGFREEQPVEGLESALERVGDILREEMPEDDDVHGNELPDEVTGDV